MQPYQRWATLDVGDYAHAQSLLRRSAGHSTSDRREEGAFTDVALNNERNQTNVTDPTKSFVLRFITESIVYEGSPTVAVNYTKDWYFNGSGVDKVPGIRDKAKWVPNSFVHKSECGHLETTCTPKGDSPAQQ